MDVEMKLEANGLPTQFASTSDQPHESHVTDNLAASISNSEAVVSPAPLKPVAPETSTVTEKVQQDPRGWGNPSPGPDVSATMAATQPPPTVPATSQTTEQTSVPNGTTEHVTEQAESSISTAPDSQPPSSAEHRHPDPAASSLTGGNITASLSPSTIPAVIQSSLAPVESSQSTLGVPAPLDPSQPPMSHLRTAPHADARSPEEVAEVEAERHALDNNADLVATPSKPDMTDHSSLAAAATMVDAAPGPAEEPQPTVFNIGLPSPPVQTPPRAFEPTPAAVEEDKPVAPATSLPAEPKPEPELEDKPVAEPTTTAHEPESKPRAEPEPAAEPVSEPIPMEMREEPGLVPALSTPAEPEDQIMEDVSAQPIKQAREREEDLDTIEPAAKRVRTDEPQTRSQDPEFKVPNVPVHSTPSGPISEASNAEGADVMAATDGDDSVTPARLAHMKKVISNLKKSNASASFRLPVDYVALKIPTYPDIIKRPMDLGQIDQRLKRNDYTSIAAFIADFELIVTNCFAFNGPEHAVSQQAKKMQSSFNGQMKNLPKANMEEPSKDSKKAAKKQEPTRSAPPRRPSVSTSTITVGSASSPKSAAPPTPSFAPGPDGIPLIRRDSSLADGRPKRAIVPTKRNQEFGGGRPKKKKYELQLKFCDEILKEIASTKHWQLNQYFTHPVDPVALNIPTYFQIIKKPMDLSTVRGKLQNNVYEKAKDFEEDVRLVFKNCYKFNPEGDLVNQSGHQLEELFNKLWARKDEWIAEREPPSEPQSDNDEEEEEESAEEADESEDERNDMIKNLQKQIELMSKQMGELTQKKKKSKSPPSKKAKSKSVKKEKPAATFPNPGKDKKEKKKPASKGKPEKDRYVTFAEKQYISNGIAMLPEKQMQEALKIIQNSVPSLANSDQNEIELDIEEVPNHALIKLLNFVKRYAGPPPDEPKAETSDSYAPTSQKSKKSKPMSKHAQEAQIEELKGKLGAYAGPMSPNAVQSIETGDSSDDDGDSEESEEE